MENTFATDLSDSQLAQLNEILDRCLVDLQKAHAQLVRDESQFQQTQAEIEAITARSERGNLDADSMIIDDVTDLPERLPGIYRRLTT